MKVFVTGGSGLVGSNVIKKLVEQGHTVAGLARSDSSAAKLTSLGATPIKGTHTDLDVLKKAASEADAAIHCAFNHEIAFSQGMAGMAQACKEDSNAITTMCESLKGKTFINSSGLLAVMGEDETCASNPQFARSANEELTLAYSKKGLRTINIRLPPVVHGPGTEHPFISGQTALAKKQGFAGYVDEGDQIWSSTHVADAAELYVLALTKGENGTHLHAVDEERIPMKRIAEYIGQKLDIPTKSITAESAAAAGFVGMVMTMGGLHTSKITRETTGWKPKEYGLFKEMESYSW